MAISDLWENVRHDVRDAALPPEERSGRIFRAIRLVLHRGSLLAAEAQTGHNCETITAWIKRLGDHAEAITDLLVREMHLPEVELDEQQL